MCSRVQHSVIVLVLLSVMLSVGNQAILNGTQNVDDITEAYIKALETFDVSKFKTSCRALTASIKTLLKFFDATRWEQLDAPLYVLPKLQQDQFPHVTYHRNCRLKSGKCRKLIRVDIMIYRADGVVFAFNRWPLSELIDSFKKNLRANDTGLFYRRDNRLITHKILAGFTLNRTKHSRRNGSKLLGFNATYLLDTYDTRNGFEEKVIF